MSRTISLTVTDAAFTRFTAVKVRLTEIRRTENDHASKANQTDAMEWILLHISMPIDTRTVGETLEEQKDVQAEFFPDAPGAI